MILRIANQIRAVNNSNLCVLKWSSNNDTRHNIGDALNPILFEKLFNKKVINFSEILNIGIPPVYAFIGSILDNTKVNNLIVAGAGFKNPTSKVKILPKRVVASRGPLTRKKLIDLGLNVPLNFGDPAILLPKFYNPKIKKKYKLGIIPHYVDKYETSIQKWCSSDEIKEIDVFSDYKTFVDDIKACEFTISSSLHGVILSHSYGIPSVWVKYSDKILGGNFKFNDYYQSLQLDPKPFLWHDNASILELQSKTTVPDMFKLQKSLMNGLSSLDL